MALESNHRSHRILLAATDEYQDRPTINGHLLGEVKHSELFSSGEVRTLHVTPIPASSSGVPQGGTMVINDLLQ